MSWTIKIHFIRGIVLNKFLTEENFFTYPDYYARFFCKSLFVSPSLLRACPLPFRKWNASATSDKVNNQVWPCIYILCTYSVFTYFQLSKTLGGRVKKSGKGSLNDNSSWAILKVICSAYWSSRIDRVRILYEASTCPFVSTIYKGTEGTDQRKQHTDVFPLDGIDTLKKTSQTVGNSQLSHCPECQGTEGTDEFIDLEHEQSEIVEWSTEF